MASKTQPIVVKLPDKALPDKGAKVCADKENSNYIESNNSEELHTTLFDDVSVTSESLGVKGKVDIPPQQSISQHTGAAPTKNVSGIGIEVAKVNRVPPARQVEYGGFTYASISKCLKALGLCRDRFKYLKKTRKELRNDKAIIGIMLHEKQKQAQQATSYVIAIQGEVMFETNLTAACTRVNQLLQLPPKEALTQGKVSKYKYEHNNRAKNKDRPINLYEAFTACLSNLLIRTNMLDAADKALFKARMDVVCNDLNDEQDLFDVVGEDNSHIDALKDLADEYHKLGGDK